MKLGQRRHSLLTFIRTMSKMVAAVFIISTTFSVEARSPDCDNPSVGIDPPLGQACAWKFYQTTYDDPIYLGSCAPCHDPCSRESWKDVCQSHCKEYYEKCIKEPPTTPHVTATPHAIWTVTAVITNLDASDDRRPNNDVLIAVAVVLGVLVVLLISVFVYREYGRRRRRQRIYELGQGIRLRQPVQVTDV